ncbi:MAG: DUF342 domain-containing protein, partial [Planctomycetes bacterium]|nr:DUF342 domain-containing protein [Planctomycetota bacterium]
MHVSVDPAHEVASVRVSPGDPGGVAELQRALQRAGVRAGVDDGAVLALGVAMADPDYVVTGAVVARGIPVENGADGQLECVLAPVAPGAARTDGSVDLRERGTIHNVAAGDALG